MGDAKKIVLKFIEKKRANEFIKKYHYSGTVCLNSRYHFGVFYEGILGGCIQVGYPIDKKRILGLMANSEWNSMMEINRIAFSEILGRNSESRAISVVIKYLKKYKSELKWLLSFADAVRCGDGAIYRAVGFCLTGIKKNKQFLIKDNEYVSALTITKNKHILKTGKASIREYLDAGYELATGYQLRYIYFLDKNYQKNLTVPVIPYSKIKEIGAGMYKGEKKD